MLDRYPCGDADLPKVDKECQDISRFCNEGLSYSEAERWTGMWRSKKRACWAATNHKNGHKSLDQLTSCWLTGIV